MESLKTQIKTWEDMINFIRGKIKFHDKEIKKLEQQIKNILKERENGDR
jgi:hypothetical protein